MVETREMQKTTFEDLLMDSVYHMRMAKREGEEYIFDELLDEVEMLFGLVPELNQNYLPTKQELEQLAAANINKVNIEAATIDDDILKDLFLAQKQAIIKWDFRTDMLETILTLMNDYQMIPYQNPFIGELGLGEFDNPDETINESEEQPQQLQQQPPQFPPFMPPQQRPVRKKVENE